LKVVNILLMTMRSAVLHSSPTGADGTADQAFGAGITKVR